MTMKHYFTHFFAAMVIMAKVSPDAQAAKTEIKVPADMDGWTVINTNADEYKWAYDADKDGAVLPQNKKLAADDWIITPEINLIGGVTYRIKSCIQSLTTYSFDRQYYNITIGSAPTAEAQTTQVYKDESFTKTAWPVERPEGDKAGLFTPEADGTYYIGFHCYSKSYMGDFLFQKFTVEEVLPLPGAVTALTATAADKGELEVNLSWTWPAVNSNGAGRTEPLAGAKLYRSSGSSISATSTYLIKDIDGGDAGAEASVTDIVPQAGKYYYMVVPFDANGDSDATPLKVQTAWVGEDTSIPTLGNVTATAIDDTTVEVGFDAPSAGGNGGYIDPLKLSYKISRKNGSGTTVTLEDAYAGVLPYVDATIPGLDNYTYTVYVQYNGSSSWSGKDSNQITCGGALTLPYSQDFAKADNLALFTIFHGPDCTRNWGVSSGKASFWGGSTADAWMVTPPFKLEAGKNYEISFDTWLSSASSESSYKNLAVTIGTKPTAGEQSTVLFDELIQSALKQGKTINFTVPADGVYHIGFHCHGQTNSNDIFVDDLSVKETAFVPAAIEAVEVKAGERGALSAVISFNAPTLTTAGTPLVTLDKIEVICGTEIIGTKENVSAGETVEITDNLITAPGFRTYSAVAYLGENASAPTVAPKLWIGIDDLKPAGNVKAEKTGDNEVTITFDNVTEGVNGGYIDTKNVRYLVTRMPDETAVATEATGSPVTDTDISGLPLARYTYSVVAFVDGSSSEPAISNALTLGEAIQLPYAPDMTDDPAAFDLWTFVADTGTGQWKHSSGKGLQTRSVSNAPYAYTPPFSAQAGTYKLICNIKSYSGMRQEMVDIILSSEPVHVAETEPQAEASPLQATPKVHTVLQTVKAESSYAADTEVPFTVTEPGVYHIGFRNVSNLHTDEPSMSWGNYLCTLDKVELSAVNIPSGLDKVDSEQEAIRHDDMASMVIVDGDCNSIRVYNLSGLLIGNADTSALEQGFYIAVADMADGTRLTLQFAKK